MAKAVLYKTKLIYLNNFFLVLTFLVLIFGEITRISLPGFGSVRILDITVIFTVLSSFFVFPKAIFSAWPVRLFSLFVVVNIISLIFAYFSINTQISVGIVHFGRLVLYFLLYPSIVLFFRKYSIIKLHKLVVVVGSAVAAIGLLQLILVPDIAFLTPYGWDPHRNRLVSSWLDPNFLSPFLVVCLSILITQFDRKNNPKINKLGQIGLLFLLILANLLTFSRSGLICIAIFVILIGIRYYRRVLAAIIIGFALIITLYAPARQRVTGIINPDITANARLISWVESVQIGLINPIIGIGYNNYSVYKIENDKIEQKNSSFGADSTILLIFATTGILGSVLFFGVFIYSIIRSLLSKRKNLYILGSGLMGVLAASNFNNIMLYPLMIPVLMLVIASINEDN